MFKAFALMLTVFALIVTYQSNTSTQKNTSVPNQNSTSNKVSPKPTKVTSQNNLIPSNNTSQLNANPPTQQISLTENWDSDFDKCPNVKINQDSNFTPYLQSMTPSSVWVSWKSELNHGSVVEYSRSPCSFNDNSSKFATGTAKLMTAFYFYNTVNLKGLESNQRYYYRVRSGRKVSGIYRFRTAPKIGANKKIRFLIFGDHQSALDKRHLLLVEAAKTKVEKKYGLPIEQSIDFVVNDGDQVQTGGLAIEWQNLHFKQSAPLSGNLSLMMTVGNHEYWLDPKLTRYRAFAKYENLDYAGIKGASDETYYAYQYGRTLVIHLNSNADTEKEARKSRAEQTKWLKNIIETAKNDSTVDFMVSILHHPYKTEASKPGSESMNNTWMAMLASTKKYAMTVSGHHHVYSRGQVIDKPVYHMISGGTGGALSAQWFDDPYSKFKNTHDIQKSIANWTWQIVEIDPATQSMKVETFAESHPNVYNLKRKMTFNSRLVDTFTRKLGQLKPQKPAITELSNGQIVDLSNEYYFNSSPFSTLSDTKLNTTQFQISRDNHFHSLEIDKIRHFEDIFGDTGHPLYTPIDLHKGLDILKFKLEKSTLSNGLHYVRVRHRDRNVEWSLWSDTVAFYVTNSDNNSSTKKNVSHSHHDHSH